MCSWRDSKAVANKLLAESIAEAEIAGVPNDKVPDSPGRNLFQRIHPQMGSVSMVQCSGDWEMIKPSVLLIREGVFYW